MRVTSCTPSAPETGRSPLSRLCTTHHSSTHQPLPCLGPTCRVALPCRLLVLVGHGARGHVRVAGRPAPARWSAHRNRLVLLSFPIAQTLATGNVNGLVMIAFGAGWIWRDRPAASGLILGTVTAWKVFPGLVIIWMLATGRWRAAAWALGGAAAWTLGAAWLFGPSTTWTYFTQVVPSTQAMGISAAYLFQAPAATYLLLVLGIGAVITLRRKARPSYSLATTDGRAGMAVTRRCISGDARRPRAGPAVSGRPRFRGADAAPRSCPMKIGSIIRMGDRRQLA